MTNKYKVLHDHILIVEDEITVARDLQMLLKQLGYSNTAMVTTGEKAIQYIEEDLPDLIMMDVVLPGKMDGIETSEIIHSKFDIPVIYLAAHREKAIFDIAKLSEPFGYLIKPFNNDEIQRAVEISLYRYNAEKERKALVEKLKREVAERKKMGEALLQSEKMKSIGTITAGIAHEFNNILAIISGNVELLEEDYGDNVELMDTLRTIKKATDDGLEISSKMLMFTKTKKSSADYLFLDICELIKESIEFTMPRWRNMAQVNNIDYQINTEGIKENLFIFCNPTEIREVFINIIINALDAMPSGGRLSFNTWKRKDTVFASISDTGIGMSEDVKKKIFDPFFTTKAPIGSGLGMSTVYGILTRHGSKIEVESEIGKGSTFVLQFPASRKNIRMETTTEPEQKINAENLHILVVDDDEDICKLLNKFLSRGGHTVKTVNNGANAIELINVERFDLVLCDLAMPKVFGYDVIKALNTLERIPKIGIITGWRNNLKLIDREDLKVDFIVKKPFDFLELTKHINDIFNHG